MESGAASSAPSGGRSVTVGSPTPGAPTLGPTTGCPGPGVVAPGVGGDGQHDDHGDEGPAERPVPRPQPAEEAEHDEGQHAGDDQASGPSLLPRPGAEGLAGDRVGLAFLRQQQPSEQVEQDPAAAGHGQDAEGDPDDQRVDVEEPCRDTSGDTSDHAVGAASGEAAHRRVGPSGRGRGGRGGVVIGHEAIVAPGASKWVSGMTLRPVRVIPDRPQGQQARTSPYVQASVVPSFT